MRNARLRGDAKVGRRARQQARRALGQVVRHNWVKAKALVVVEENELSKVCRTKPLACDTHSRS